MSHLQQYITDWVLVQNPPVFLLILQLPAKAWLTTLELVYTGSFSPCMQQTNEIASCPHVWSCQWLMLKLEGKVSLLVLHLSKLNSFPTTVLFCQFIKTFQSQSFWIAAVTQPVCVRVRERVRERDMLEAAEFYGGTRLFYPSFTHPVGAHSSGQISSVPLPHASIIKCGLHSVV